MRSNINMLSLIRKYKEYMASLARIPARRGPRRQVDQAARLRARVHDLRVHKRRKDQHKMQYPIKVDQNRNYQDFSTTSIYEC